MSYTYQVDQARFAKMFKDHSAAKEAEKGEWEEVYNAGLANKDAKPQSFKEASSYDVPCDPKYSGFFYYETHKGKWKSDHLCGDFTDGYITDGKILLKAYRSWMSADWEITEVKGDLIFRPGDEKEGRPNQVKVTINDE